MATSLDDIINSFPPERREKIEHLTAELLEQVVTMLNKERKLRTLKENADSSCFTERYRNSF